MLKKPHYAWVIMIACFGLQLNTGLQLAMGAAFLKPVSVALSVSRTSFSLFNLVGGFFGMYAGTVAARFYIRFHMKRTVIWSLILSTAATFGYSFAQSIWQFVIWSPLYGFCSGLSTMIPCSILLNNWFQEKRGMATSIAFMGSTVGSLVFIQIATRAIAAWDWRVAYQVLGILRIAVVVPIAFFLLIEKPMDKGLLPYGYHESDISGLEAGEVRGITKKAFVRTWPFYAVCIATSCAGLSVLGIQNHFQAFLSDVGYTPIEAANIFSILLTIQMIGKLLIGVFLDKFGKKFGLIYVTAAFVVGTFCLLNIGTSPTLVYAAITGIALSAAQVTIFPPYMTADIVGLRDYAAIIGLVQVFSNIGTSFSSSVTSVIYDLSGGYSMAWYVYIVASILGFAAYLSAIRVGRDYRDR